MYDPKKLGKPSVCTANDLRDYLDRQGLLSTGTHPSAALKHAYPPHRFKKSIYRLAIVSVNKTTASPWCERRIAPPVYERNIAKQGEARPLGQLPHSLQTHSKPSSFQLEGSMGNAKAEQVPLPPLEREGIASVHLHPAHRHKRPSYHSSCTDHKGGQGRHKNTVPFSTTHPASRMYTAN